MASKYIRVGGVTYIRADAISETLTPLLLDAWRQSREYTSFIRNEVVPVFVERRDMQGLAARLRDKFSMWVSEQLLSQVEDSIDWLGEAHELARRDR